MFPCSPTYHLYFCHTYYFYWLIKSENENKWRGIFKKNSIIVDFLYHLTIVFTNYSMNIDQLVFKLLEVTLVLVRKSLKFLLLGNQWTIELCFINFFTDENFLSDETSLILFQVEKNFHWNSFLSYNWHYA